MTGLIKEEILTTIKKKRFIALALIAFTGAIVSAILTKNDYWNDLTYYFSVKDYMFMVFNPLISFALIISVYRKQYTRTSILQVEDRGAKRSSGVIARAVSGTVIIIAAYAIMAALILLPGLILGAHNTPAQTCELLLKTGLDCAASIAVYIASLFWLYLFAFPIVPALVSLLFLLGIPCIFRYINLYFSAYYQITGAIVPKVTCDIVFTDIVLSNLRPLFLLFYVLQLAVPFLLTLLVFKLKKLKPVKEKKKKKSKNADDEAPSEVQISEV